MSPLNDDNHYITIPGGSIDYAVYENRARAQRSAALGAFACGLKGLFLRLRRQLSIRSRIAANGLATSPGC